MSSLERVLTVHQTSMGATRLPLELQQLVFSFLDSKSFYAARKVCKWWRFASDDAVTLSRQLQRLPIRPPVDASKSTPRELQRLFGEAARALLLGMQVVRLRDVDGNMTSARRVGTPLGPRVTAVSRGNRTVTLNDRTMAVFDTSGREPVVLSQRLLNDLKETVGSGPWLKVSGNWARELALSSDGNLLAVAQERTIQIYDLCADSDSFTVNEYISCAAGTAISGLAFEQNDRVLRVKLSGNGTVLYLGTPPSSQGDVKRGTIEHWKSKAGLKHTLLDSSLLTLELQALATDNSVRISGLQLLRPFHGGHLFAAQKHGGNESSHYILGHVKSSNTQFFYAEIGQSNNVTILSRLESFLSSWDYTVSGVHESGMGLWENMPSAHEHHPDFALSPDGTVLVLAERDKKCIRPTPLSQIFLYRLPSEASMLEMLRQKERASDLLRSLAHKRDGFLNALSQDTTPSGQINTSRKYSIGRIPLCLSTVRGTVTEVKFADQSSNGLKTCELSVITPESTKCWSLTEM